MVRSLSYPGRSSISSWCNDYDGATNARFRPDKPSGATSKSLIVLNPSLSNVLHSRTSEATTDSVATDADLTPQGRLLTGTDDVWDGGYGQWTAYYTGP